MPGRRRPGHETRAHASVLVTAVRLRHGARRYPRHPRTGGRARHSARGVEGDFSNWRRRSARTTRSEVAGQGYRPKRSKSSCARISVTPAPIRRLSCRPDRRRDERAFEKAHKARFGFIDRAKQMVVEAVSVEAVGGGAKFNEKKMKRSRAKLPAPALRTRFFSAGAWHKANVYPRDQLKPGSRVRGAAIIIEPHQTVVVEPGWQAELTAKNHLVLTRAKKLKRTACDRHACRPGHAGGVQQSVHVDRRADGRIPAEHRLLGEHQGAAGFFLRGVRA